VSSSGQAAPELVVHPDAAAVQAVTAGRLLAALLDAQARNLDAQADVVLTGGGVGIGVLAALCVAPGRDALAWGRLHVWWGDERWVPEDDPDRNAGQARAALLDAVPVNSEKVHVMAAGRPGASMDADAAAYAGELEERARERGDAGPVPAFDVLLLGTGPEGHVGSVFPHSTAVAEQTRPVVAVPDCPKPPEQRLTLTLPAMRAAREVWVVTAGEEKADAVAAVMHGAREVDVPAAGARGRLRTLWLVDRAAASRV
jgi:6-phosphogluconolactonase